MNAEKNTDLEVPISLSPDQAWDLAQFVKRLTWNDIQRCAVDKAETNRMRDAIEILQQALADAGISPR